MIVSKSQDCGRYRFRAYSSIGSAVHVARLLFDSPILRVSESMDDAAVKIGGRIGVAATIRTIREPTIALIEDPRHEVGERPGQGEFRAARG